MARPKRTVDGLAFAALIPKNWRSWVVRQDGRIAAEPSTLNHRR
jgi:hypothetical protein